jgi:glutamate synthase (NADPH/NADH) small chain
VDEKRQPVPGTEFTMPADLVLLAIGFDGVEIVRSIWPIRRFTMAPRNTIEADDVNYRTSQDKLFAAGDMRRGASLVVWAIREGRQAARAIDLALMGQTLLPR